jgi:hypothetical protein
MHTVIHVAGHRLETSRGLALGAAVYSLAGIDPIRHHLLLELDDDRDIPLKIEDHIVINGKERFSIGDGPCPTDDNPRLRKALAFVINEAALPPEQQLHHAKLTFDQLVALDPNFEPGDGIFFDLRDVPDVQIMPGTRVLMQSDDRLYTSPCGNVGFESKLDVDLAALRDHFGVVDLFEESSRSLIVVRNVPLPSHWSRPVTDVLLQVPQGYPIAAMDMFGFRQDLPWLMAVRHREVS